jgi:hypothetical protein
VNRLYLQSEASVFPNIMFHAEPIVTVVMASNNIPVFPNIMFHAEPIVTVVMASSNIPFIPRQHNAYPRVQGRFIVIFADRVSFVIPGSLVSLSTSAE